jgi:DNA-binding XRE family transcriptional regulator
MIATKRRGRLPGIEVDPGAIRQARLAAGLSMAQVAGTDFTRQTVFLIEAGKTKPSMRTLEIIAARTMRPVQSFLKGGSAPAIHKTRPVRVWVDVDQGVADVVDTLNRHPDVRTFASCEGTPGHRPAYIMVGWLTTEAFIWLTDNFVLTEISRDNCWAYLHPFAKLVDTRTVPQ